MCIKTLYSALQGLEPLNTVSYLTMLVLWFSNTLGQSYKLWNCCVTGNINNNNNIYKKNEPIIKLTIPPGKISFKIYILFGLAKARLKLSQS